MGKRNRGAHQSTIWIATSDLPRTAEAPPDHSTISRTRRLIDLETHKAVFTWILERLAEAGLVKGKTIGMDATTLEANAALRSIVRRDTGESYQEFLTQLAKASGIETPTREDLARLDRKRKHKGSNDDWTHPQDPDAKITKMKDGRTHLAHKAEHAVDLETGAVVGVTVQDADKGDTTTSIKTLMEAAEQIEATCLSAGSPQHPQAYTATRCGVEFGVVDANALRCGHAAGPTGPRCGAFCSCLVARNDLRDTLGVVSKLVSIDNGESSLTQFSQSSSNQIPVHELFCHGLLGRIDKGFRLILDDLEDNYRAGRDVRGALWRS